MKFSCLINKKNPVNAGVNDNKLGIYFLRTNIVP